MKRCMNCGHIVKDEILVCPKCDTEDRFQKLDRHRVLKTTSEITFYISVGLFSLVILMYLIAAIKIGLYERNFFEYTYISAEMFVIYFALPIGTLMSFYTLFKAKNEFDAKEVPYKHTVRTKLLFIAFLIISIIPLILL